MGGTFILFIFFVFFYIYTYVVQQCKLCVEYDSHSAYEEAGSRVVHMLEIIIAE